MLVIPDVFSRRYTSELLTMLLRHMKFRGALVQQVYTHIIWIWIPPREHMINYWIENSRNRVVPHSVLVYRVPVLWMWEHKRLPLLVLRMVYASLTHGKHP